MTRLAWSDDSSRYWLKILPATISEIG